MQAISVTISGNGYDGSMKTGRPSTQPRTSFGERLLVAREALGLSQSQIAQKMNVSQKAYAVWERYPVALRPDQIEKLAEILNVAVEHLFNGNRHDKRGAGPTGKVRQVFEKVSRLPRYQQNKVVEFVDAFVNQKAVASS
jgi:transcriptional regulator with XRE-family HTH domain